MMIFIEIMGCNLRNIEFGTHSINLLSYLYLFNVLKKNISLPKKRKMKRFITSLITFCGLCVPSCLAQYNITIDEAYEKITKDKKIQLIDVRTPSEFASGHIEGAKNIDFKSPDFEKQIAKLKKRKPVLLYCRSGNRSLQAIKNFRNVGFNKKPIYNMVGGILAWQKKYPVVKD